MSGDRRERGVCYVGTVTYLSTGRAAAMVGVSDRTLRREADRGRIPAITTPGGHWRVPAAWVRRQVAE